MDHLESLLRPFDPGVRAYIGHALRLERGGTWMSGGAGYVLTREAFRSVMLNYLLPNPVSKDTF